MRLNENTMLLGKKVVLVPYTSEHVPRYHEWMKSEELQRLTASEPLTLEQEYAMQCSWREDEDKCTFIVLDAEKCRAQPCPTEESCMVGDVNLFLTDLEDPSLGEIEVMIAETPTHPCIVLRWRGWENRCLCCTPGASGTFTPVCLFLTLMANSSSTLSCEDSVNWCLSGANTRAWSLVPAPVCSLLEPSCRGQGFGTEAALLMMSYGVTKLGLTKFEAKIGQENEPSIRMFQKLHFKPVAVSSIFQEVTLTLAVSEPERQWLLEQTSHVEEKPYRDELAESL